MEKEKNNIIGSNIHSIRKRMGYTQEYLASYLEIPREMISYYESGVRMVPLKVLNQLADLFNIKVSDFLEEDEAIKAANSNFVAFRASEFDTSDRDHIIHFQKIVKNYIRMKIVNERMKE